MTERKKSPWGELAYSVVVAVALALTIRFFVFEPFFIPSSSMAPTLLPGDRIIVSKFNYWFRPPDRGDVLVFRYPIDPSKDYVKRIVALAGDTVEVRNGRVLVNDMDEAGAAVQAAVRGSFGPVTVPPGHVFVMGDNRNNSQDSRVWGPLPEENVVGEAVVVFWPFDRVGLVH